MGVVAALGAQIARAPVGRGRCCCRATRRGRGGRVALDGVIERSCSCGERSDGRGSPAGLSSVVVSSLCSTHSAWLCGAIRHSEALGRDQTGCNGGDECLETHGDATRSCTACVCACRSCAPAGHRAAAEGTGEDGFIASSKYLQSQAQARAKARHAGLRILVSS